jgi:hypothetical protein
VNPIEGWGDHDHIHYLSTLIVPYFFSEMIMRRILSPTRGRDFKAQIFADILPTAYFACRELVLRSPKDGALNNKIENVLCQLRECDPSAEGLLTKAERVRNSYRDEVIMICLVYWAFYGAWEIHGLKGIRQPKEAFDQYLYGRKRSSSIALLEMTKKNYTDIHQTAVTLNHWKELCLSGRGAAARFFGLL